MSKVWLLAILISAFAHPIYAESKYQEVSSEPKNIRLCAGIHQWPPYYYLESSEPNNSQIVKGLDIELFDQVFKENGISYTVTLLSWPKCLAEAIHGTKFDAVFGAGLNEDRRSNYLTTKGYYSVIPSYFYKEDAFADAPNIKSPADFKKVGHLCGVKGFNYSNFGLSNDDIDKGSDNYERLILKTLFQRCQISFVRYEIVEGWSQLLNMSFINNDELKFVPVPGVPKETFHLMISKNYKYRDEIKKLFESEIDRLKDTDRFNWMNVEPKPP
jgi:polar amino acid transport system substrate-binding protein